jgi:uncharacterized protein
MVVSNTTVILYLLKVNRPDLLKNYCNFILIPNEVYEELSINKGKFEKEIILLDELIKEKFIKVIKLKKFKHFGLDKGENAALSLCAEENYKKFLSDDRGARRTAERLNYKVSGTIGVLLENITKKNLTKKEFIVILDSLIDEGYYLSSKAYAEVIKLLG